MTGSSPEPLDAVLVRGHKISTVSQHEPLPPLAVLKRMIKQNPKAYACIRGALDQAIQEECAIWAPRYPNLYDMDQSVLAAGVRQLVRYYLPTMPEFKKSGMRLSARVNCSIVLSGKGSPAHSVRKHPRNLATAQLLPSTEYQADTLFGEDYEVVPWKPYVAWVADLKTQVLEEAWLAAISHFNTHTKTVVFDKVPLPPAIMPKLRKPGTKAKSTEEHKWPEWAGKKGGDSPA